MFTLVIVGCGKSKRKFACPATDMYTGQLFIASRRYAKTRGDAWLIWLVV